MANLGIDIVAQGFEIGDCIDGIAFIDHMPLFIQDQEPVEQFINIRIRLMDVHNDQTPF